MEPDEKWKSHVAKATKASWARYWAADTREEKSAALRDIEVDAAVRTALERCAAWSVEHNVGRKTPLAIGTHILEQAQKLGLGHATYGYPTWMRMTFWFGIKDVWREGGA